jgi:hypothetical protein
LNLSKLTSPAALLALALVAVVSPGCSGTGSGPGSEVPAPPNTAAPTSGDDGVRRNPVVAGRPARVFIMAGFDSNCQSLAAPVITITEPPAKGSVSFEPGQETTVNTSATGTCVGQKVVGTGIYYTARADQSGSDRFSIHAELGRDATDRSFSVEIVQ